MLSRVGLVYKLVKGVDHVMLLFHREVCFTHRTLMPNKSSNCNHGLCLFQCCVQQTVTDLSSSNIQTSTSAFGDSRLNQLKKLPDSLSIGASQSISIFVRNTDFHTCTCCSAAQNQSDLHPMTNLNSMHTMSYDFETSF